METGSNITFVAGLTKMGKSALCNFLIGSELKITKPGVKYQIEADNQSIVSSCDSLTKEANFYRDFCELSFNNSRSQLDHFNTSCQILGVLEKFSFFRVILLAEFSTLQSSNMSTFINLTQNLIDLFNLQPHHQQSIIIIISKISEIGISSISFSEIFKKKQNFIIEGLKSKTIKCLYFKNPAKLNTKYFLKNHNRAEILSQLEITDYLKSSEFLFPLHQQMRTILPSIRDKLDCIKFSSKLNIDSKVFIIDEYFCIDKDFELIDQSLTIISTFIIVFPSNPTDKIKITLKGNSELSFSPSIKYFINHDALSIVYASSFDLNKFPDPFADEFNLNEEYFRLESICINDFLKEYATHNNKFVELIMNAKDHSNKLKNHSGYIINSSMIEIKLKLNINECTKRKENITSKYISMRSCNNIDEYLEKCKKSKHVKALLEKCISNIPTLFQILLEEKNLIKLSSYQKYYKDLNSIRSILIQRYLNLINDIRNQANYSENLSEALNAFSEFLSTIPDLNKTSNAINSKEKRIKIENFIRENLSKEILNDFLGIFHLLFTTDKPRLFNYQIIGDCSIYGNFEAAKNVERFSIRSFLGSKLFETGPIFGIALGIALRNGINYGTTLAGMVGLGYFAAGIFGNVLYSYYKSGYYPGELDWREEYEGFDEVFNLFRV